MIKLTLLIPFLGMTAFGGYYHHWDTEYRARTCADPKNPLAAYAQRDARGDAERDLAEGHRTLLTYGEPAAWQTEYDGMLSRIYDVHQRSLTDKELPATVKHYVDTYNAIVEHHLATRFGADVLQETRIMAQKRHAINERVRNYIPPP